MLDLDFASAGAIVVVVIYLVVLGLVGVVVCLPVYGPRRHGGGGVAFPPQSP